MGDVMERRQTVTDSISIVIVGMGKRGEGMWRGCGGRR